MVKLLKIYIQNRFNETVNVKEFLCTNQIIVKRFFLKQANPILKHLIFKFFFYRLSDYIRSPYKANNQIMKGKGVLDIREPKKC